MSGQPRRCRDRQRGDPRHAEPPARQWSAVTNHHPQEQPHHHQQRQAGDPDLAEPRVPYRRDLVGREPVAEAAPRCVRALQEEAEHGAREGQHKGSQEELAHSQHMATLGPEVRREPPGTQQQREPDEYPEPHHPEEHTYVGIALFAALRAFGQTLRVGARSVGSVTERERALDRVRVGRHHSPHDGVQPLVQLGEAHADGLAVTAGVNWFPGVHRVAAIVEDLHAVVTDIDPLREVEHNCFGSGVQGRLRRRRRILQDRVRERWSCEREQHGQRDHYEDRGVAGSAHDPTHRNTTFRSRAVTSPLPVARAMSQTAANPATSAPCAIAVPGTV